MKQNEIFEKYKNEICKECQEKQDCEGIVIDIKGTPKCLKEFENYK